MYAAKIAVHMLFSSQQNEQVVSGVSKADLEGFHASCVIF